MAKIANFIKPYISPKANYAKLQYQLPFLLMANQVLRCTSHFIQYLKLLSVINPTALHTLLINANTRYSLFFSESTPQQMVICNFKNEMILQQFVNSHNDAAFSTFLDVAYLTRLTASYGNQFSNRLRLLPGTKDGASARYNRTPPASSTPSATVF